MNDVSDRERTLRLREADAFSAAPSPAVRQLRSTLFRRGREGNWRSLGSLVERVEEDGLDSLSAAEAQRLPLLYRLTVSSLSVARGMVQDRNLLLYLENLALRAYLIVYGPRASLAAEAVDFVERGFPRRVRAFRIHLLFAALILLSALCVGYRLVGTDPDMFYLLVPEAVAEVCGPDFVRDDLRRPLFAPFPGVVDTVVFFAGALFRDNAVLGLLCFGLGFALGVPTLLLLAYKGLTLGALLAVYAGKGLGTDFVGWMAVHGVTKTLALLLCAAAGFVVAERLVFPGRLSRLDSLAEAGRAAAGLVVGAVGLFFLAAIIEGGVRQLIGETRLRYLAALMTAAAWLCYFTLAGKDGRDGDDC